MIEVKKDLDSSNYECYCLKTDKGLFEICWGGNLDLYWMFIPKDEKSDKYTIDITKEDYRLYSLIDEIYDAVSSCKPFKYAPKLSIDESYEDKEVSKFDLRARDYLLKEDEIMWISDDGMEEDAARVGIKKGEDKYEITFKKGWAEHHYTYSIRFGNSGSRYEPFNAPFAVMYNKLKYYDEDSMQIHIEEYIYKKKHKNIGV